MLGDLPVKASSQVVTYRDTVTLVGGPGVPISSTGNVGPWYVWMLPRQFVWIRQTNGTLGSLAIEWAIRDSAVAGTPEWLPLATIPIAVIGTAIGTNFTTGAVWLRFTITGVLGDVYELAGTAFV